MGIQQIKKTIQNQFETLNKYSLTKSVSMMSMSKYSFKPDFITGGGWGGFATKKPSSVLETI